MSLRHFAALSLLMTLLHCTPQHQESDDIKSILDLLKRLDERETRIRQLETIVRVQEGKSQRWKYRRR